MELDTTFFALAIPAVLFAGISKGGFGSGAAFAATPILALILEPAQAVGLMLPLLMLMDVTGLRSFWGKWSWHHASRLMAGMVPGVVVGWLLFHVVSADGVRLIVGSVAIGFVIYQVARSRGWLQIGTTFASTGWGLVMGAFAGFTSFVSHAGGPPAALYLLGSKLDKTKYQATTVLAFWWANLIKFVPYFALGMFSTDSFRANLLLAPVAVIGVLLGVAAHGRLPEKLFFQITYVLLFITGSKLIWDALT